MRRGAEASPESAKGDAYDGPGEPSIAGSLPPHPHLPGQWATGRSTVYRACLPHILGMVLALGTIEPTALRL